MDLQYRPKTVPALSDLCLTLEVLHEWKSVSFHCSSKRFRFSTIVVGFSLLFVETDLLLAI